MGKREWFRRENRKSGTEIWFGTLGCDTLVEGNRVTGVVVATPDGRGVVLAKNVVGTTNCSDVAAAAGAKCMFVGSDEIAVQGVGLSPRRLGASYINSDFGYANDCDAGDLWLFGVRGRALARRTRGTSRLAGSEPRAPAHRWATPSSRRSTFSTSAPSPTRSSARAATSIATATRSPK